MAFLRKDFNAQTKLLQFPDFTFDPPSPTTIQ